MRELENVAGLAFPFALGTAAGAVVLRFSPSPLPLAGLSFILLCLAAMSLLGPWHRKAVPLAIALLLCGLSSSLSESVYSPYKSKGFLTRNAELLAMKTGELIDSMPYETAEVVSVVKAMTIGDRSSLSKDTVAVFKNAGASHLLALSGLHLGLLYSILLWMSSFIGRSPHARRVRSCFIITACAAYSVSTGASPSVMRAFFFVLLGEISRLLGRTRNLGRTYCGALLLQLTLKPSSISSLGFQLSYLAMAGIVTVYPRLNAWYPNSQGDRWNAVRKIWELASLSISCQLFTAPLVYFTFGTFPKYFLLSNLMAMPLASIAMLLSVFAIALTALGLCPQLLIHVNEKTLGILLWTLRVISDM